MRIVATSDTHFPLRIGAPYIPGGDIFIHAGDLMYSGYEREWYLLVEVLESISIKEKYLVAGNHDLHIQHYPGPALQDLRAVGVTLVGPPSTKYPTVELPNGMRMLGLPFVTNLGNWAFNADEEYIWDYLDNVGRADIVVSHSPPRGILDRVNSRTHCGIAAYRRYLKKFQPKLWISGHIHEEYGTTEVEGCRFYNVAMCNHNYEQVNPPMVIDIYEANPYVNASTVK